MGHKANASISAAALMGALVLIAVALAFVDLAVLTSASVADHWGIVLLLGLLVPGLLGALLGLLLGLLLKAVGRQWLGSRPQLKICGLLVLVLLAGPILAPFCADELPVPAAGAEGRPRIVLLGIDGATWDLMDPLMEAGEMPNLSRLVREGTRGILESELPAFSPIVWTTIASGQPQEVHRVSGATETARHVGCVRIWDILRRQGYTTGTFGYLITWPPRREADGFSVPGWTAHGPEAEPEAYGFVNRLRFMSTSTGLPSPLDLLRIYRDWARTGGRFSTVARALGRFRDADALLPDATDFFHLSREALLDIKTDAFVHLVRTRPTDFTAYYMDTVDNESHLYWRWFEPTKFEGVDEAKIKRYADVIPQSYRHVDEALGRAVEAIGPYDFLLLVSDHGFEAGNRNQFTINVRNLVQAIGMPEDAVEGYVIIYPRFYLKPASAEVAEEIVARVGRVTDAETGIPLFISEIVENGDVEIGVNNTELIGKFKDLGQTARDRAAAEVIYEGQRLPISRLVDLASRSFSGAHNLDGILLAHGEGVRQGATIDKTSIYDVVPTLLAVLGMPQAEDMRGKVVTELFEPSFFPNLELSKVATYEREGENPGAESGEEMPDALKDHLRSLGYID